MLFLSNDEFWRLLPGALKRTQQKKKALEMIQ